MKEHWYFFILSIIIAFGGANVIQVLYSPPMKLATILFVFGFFSGQCAGYALRMKHHDS